MTSPCQAIRIIKSSEEDLKTHKKVELKSIQANQTCKATTQERYKTFIKSCYVLKSSFLELL